MSLEIMHKNLTAHLTRCDQCDALRTHSTQRGHEMPDGTIEWREEINGCKKHPAIAVVVKLNGTTEVWKG